MSQVSRPYQFALGAVLIFGVLWLLVLRPSDSVSAEPPLPGAPGAAQTAPAAGAAPGVAGLGNAVERAQDAVTTSGTAAAATQQAAAQASGEATPAPASPVSAPATDAPTSTAAPAADAPAPAGQATPQDPSRPILDAVARGAVAVVLFSERNAADDREVRRAVRAVSRRDGRVRVVSAPIADVGRYEAITRGVQVLAAPTVLVIGRDRAARTIVGFTGTAEIEQLVDDTLRRTRGR
ncbi:hypothetical protein GKE82_01065 [Conexibacter sp. W3-3-2]|uniref:Thioredoxin domain-containing protein n=1 Tax=Paraconexibacter algicola TaxID=2133960 RepID=A0A2T4UED7_9ACTN|nr:MULTISPECIES: hypothetical protein [Solirubrobacterales]MTD42928.1 hypothetical protein [Conexibacter sp. W3-3-2]PTL56158.1 hypothetical protein C7Y72_14285 [Paraconexibacter algicola]